jgi:REP element-mobilizing transposase RayT
MPSQLQLPIPPKWGGARAGAGRPPERERSGPTHSRRPDHDPRHPVHVTLRAESDVPSLRSPRMFAALRRAIGAANRVAFRTIHFSVQLDHLHLIVEADSARALRQGMRSLTIRCALVINRMAHRRGVVWDHRHHAHALRTPTEVRQAMAYVLLNFRKHLRAAPGVDPRSSGIWFEEWRQPPPRSSAPRLVATPTTWLGSVGWRRAGGPLDVRESPRAGLSARRSRRRRPRRAAGAPTRPG